jgi:hypothetical protein
METGMEEHSVLRRSADKTRAITPEEIDRVPARVASERFPAARLPDRLPWPFAALLIGLIAVGLWTLIIAAISAVTG